MLKTRRTLALILLASMLLTACGKDGKMYGSGKEGYTRLDDVDGISFELVSSVARNATAITNISEDMEFEADQTYLYKDGESAYFIFNMSTIVCAIQKGTNFDFKNSENKKASLENGNVLGVWFSTPKKKLEFIEDEKDGVYKFIAPVTAQVTLTAELYNDFAGKLVVINDGTQEWSMFVGTLGKNYEKLDKENKSVISYMASTLSLYDKPEVQATPTPPVALGGDYESDTTVSENETIEENPSPSQIPEATPEKIEIAESTDESEIESPTPTIEPSEDDISNSPVPTTIEEQENATDVEITPTPTAPPTTTPEAAPEEDEIVLEVHEVEATPTPMPERGQSIHLNNQKNTVRDDNNIYMSSIYDLLEVGKRGYASIFTGSGYETANLRIDSITTGKEAENIIKNAVAKGQMYGEYFAPADGCTFHVAHCKLDTSNCMGTGYLNVKLRGMHGENLRFRGIEYTSRTYVITVSEDEYYCFYEVPNGCKEYVLECGEGTVENEDSGVISAYYKVTDF